MIKIVFDKQASQWYNIPRNQDDFKDSQKGENRESFISSVDDYAYDNVAGGGRRKRVF